MPTTINPPKKHDTKALDKPAYKSIFVVVIVVHVIHSLQFGLVLDSHYVFNYR